MGLGWDPARGRGNIDLDASVLAFDPSGRLLETVYFAHRKAFGGVIKHNGDNLTGKGEGDDETIDINLLALPPQVATLVFVITSYRGHRFNDVKNAFCRLVEATSRAELVRYNLSEAQPATGGADGGAEADAAGLLGDAGDRRVPRRQDRQAARARRHRVGPARLTGSARCRLCRAAVDSRPGN